MRVDKTAANVALQIIVCLTIIIPVLCLMAGCTLVIDSTDVNTEVIPAVSAVELAL